MLDALIALDLSRRETKRQFEKARDTRRDGRLPSLFGPRPRRLDAEFDSGRTCPVESTTAGIRSALPGWRTSSPAQKCGTDLGRVL